MSIYIVEFEGSSKGSYQMAYNSIAEVYEGWLLYKKDIENSWNINCKRFPKFASNPLIKIEDQDLFFTIRITNKDHSIGPRQKVIFDENKNLVKVSIKKIMPKDEGYISGRTMISKGWNQYKVIRKKIHLKYED